MACIRRLQHVCLHRRGIGQEPGMCSHLPVPVLLSTFQLSRFVLLPALSGAGKPIKRKTQQIACFHTFSSAVVVSHIAWDLSRGLRGNFCFSSRNSFPVTSDSRISGDLLMD